MRGVMAAWRVLIASLASAVLLVGCRSPLLPSRAFVEGMIAEHDQARRLEAAYRDQNPQQRLWLTRPLRELLRAWGRPSKVQLDRHGGGRVTYEIPQPYPIGAPPEHVHGFLVIVEEGLIAELVKF